MNSTTTHIPTQINSTGTHILAEYSDCDPEILSDCDAIEELLAKAAEAAGATIVARKSHPVHSGGVICVVVLQESHLSVHTWPEKGYAAADFFTCGKCVSHNAHPVLEAGLSAGTSKVIVVERGLPGTPKLRVLGHRAMKKVIVDCHDAKLPETVCVRKSPGRGLGLFATRSFEPGVSIYETSMWLASFDTQYIMQSDAGESILSADDLGSTFTISEVEAFPKHICETLREHYGLDDSVSTAVFRDHLTGGGENEVLVTTFDGLMNHSSTPNSKVEPDVRSVTFEDGEPVWTIRIVASKSIKAGDELFWDYSDASGFIPPSNWHS